MKSTLEETILADYFGAVVEVICRMENCSMIRFCGQKFVVGVESRSGRLIHGNALVNRGNRTALEATLKGISAFIVGFPVPVQLPTTNAEYAFVVATKDFPD